jgi:hypothetical protein
MASLDMPEPTNGELALMLTGLTDKFDDFADRNQSDHEDLKSHVETTNGRVTKLEQAKWMLYGGWICATAFAVPMLISIILKEIK